MHLFLNKIPFTGLPFIFPDRVYVHKTDEGSNASKDGVTETDVIDAYNDHIRKLDEKREKGKQMAPKWYNRLSIKEFLWTCAGADKNLLRTCPHDQTKYACIGGTILFTAMCAALSSSYACSTIFEDNKYCTELSVCIGIFWGLLIFNLDRMITNTMYSDGKPSISLMEVLSGLPRIIMAIIIGIVISVPLELKIFKGEIDKALQKDKEIYVNEEVKKDTIRYRNDIKIIEADIRNVENEIKRYGDLNTEGTLIYNEAKNKTRPGIGKIVAKLEGKRDSLLYIVLPQLEQQRKTKNDSLSVFVSSQKNFAEQNYENIEVGLSRRIEYLLQVTEKEPLNWVHRFIALFFIIVEITPVLMKMMMSSGVYDVMMDKEADFSAQKYRAETSNMTNLIHSGKLADDADEIIGVSKYGKSHGVFYYMHLRLKRKLMKWATGRTPEEGDTPMEKNYSASDNKRIIDEKNHERLKSIVSKVDAYMDQYIDETLGVSNDTKRPTHSKVEIDNTVKPKPDPSAEAVTIGENG